MPQAGTAAVLFLLVTSQVIPTTRDKLAGNIPDYEKAELARELRRTSSPKVVKGGTQELELDNRRGQYIQYWESGRQAVAHSRGHGTYDVVTT